MMVHPFNYNTFEIVINLRFFNILSAVVVLIGRLMHRVTSIVPLMPQMQDAYAREIIWSSCLSWPGDRPKLSHLLFLPWCMAIAGYNTSSDNSNSQQQLKVGWRQQANHYRAQVSQEEWKPLQMEYACDNSSMLTLFLMFYTQVMV